MRCSRLLMPTLKEPPQEASIASHALLLRAGYLRALAAGAFSYLPLGLRSLARAAGIVRREMDRAGAQEMLLPAVQPLALWQETGRDAVLGEVLVRFRDRRGRDVVLGPTHEEVITDIVRNDVRSYRQLPLNLYQIQTKFRDEERPRGGIVRTREFIMKDAYSFDADKAGLEVSYQRMYEAYCRIFSRAGLRYVAVEAESGAIGGDVSHEFMVPAEAGEDRLVQCSRCGYAANVERCELPAPPAAEPGDGESQPIHTPGMTTIEQVCAFLNVEPALLVKTLLYKGRRGVYAALVRGDCEVNETKLARVAGEPLAMADAETVERASGAAVGFAGPVGLEGVRMIADNSLLAMRQFVVGANRDDYHLVNVARERDFHADVYADIRRARDGDACPRCGREEETRGDEGGSLKVIRCIEVGHVFKLGTKYSEAMSARFLDADGVLKPFVMGCYGVGISRMLAAAIEQAGGHDAAGIIWPPALAPFDVHIVCTNPQEPALAAAAERLYAALLERGIEVIYDDRDERAGVKFNDADLVGVPLRLTVGPRGLKKGIVEYRRRDGSVAGELGLDAAAGAVARMVSDASVDLPHQKAEGGLKPTLHG